MDAINIIEKLAKTAQKEQMPEIDVSRAVMLEIGLLRREKTSVIPFEWFAGISAVAASILILLSLGAWQYMVSPFAQLLAPFQEGLLW
ncbi:MAG: hypothetical protein ABSE89_00175 [Sedimentisphaerales bacterium]